MSLYIGKQFIVSFISIFTILLVLILLVDMIELLEGPRQNRKSILPWLLKWPS